MTTKSKTYDQGVKDGLDQALIILNLYASSILDGFMEVQDIVDELSSTIRLAQGSVGKSVSQPAATGSQASNPGAGSSPAATAIVQSISSLPSTRKFTVPTTLKGHNIVFTGGLVSMTRKDAEAKARAKGAHTQSKVAMNTSILVVGKGAGAKLDEGINKRVIIIDEQTFLNLIA